MSSVQMSPQELLFGVFAAQAGLLSQEDLAEAAKAQAAVGAGPVVSLADRLVAAGRLTREDAALLQGLVARSIEAHHGEVQAALATAGGAPAAALSFGVMVTMDSDGQAAALSFASDATAAPERPDEGIHDPDEKSHISAEQPGRYGLLDKTALYERSQHKHTDDPTTAELGRGGMGRVLVAFDRHLGREVALKELIPPRSALRPAPPAATPRSPVTPVTGTAQQAARFLREARVTGQLEHPSIVPVYELGRRRDGTLYYTMRLVRGRTLKQALRGCNGLRERLRLLSHVADLCHAMAYAHSRGVVNRDIKPDNVMVGEFGETAVLDWGLAKVLGREDLRSREVARKIEQFDEAAAGMTVAEFLGTPNYMSPEQASGRLDQVDERSDLWSIGVVLYELLAGHPPFKGHSVMEIVTKVRAAAVPPVRAVEPAAPVELAAIAMRCLERDPARRYQSAREMCRDLESYQAGERVTAYEYTSWDLIRRFVARNRALSVAVAAALLVLVVSMIVVYRNYEAALRSEAEARTAEARAVTSEEAAVASEKEARTSEGRAVESRNQAQLSETASQLAEEQARLSEEQARVALAAAFREKARAEMSEGRTNLGTAYLALSLANRENPEVRGEWLAAAQSPLPRLMWAVLPPLSPTMAAASPDGRFLAVGDSAGPPRLYDLTDGRMLPVAAGSGQATSMVAFAPNGLAVLIDDEGDLFLWDPLRRSTVGEHALPGSPAASCVAISPDGRHLALPDRNGQARVFGLLDGIDRRALQGHDGGVVALSFSNDGERILTADGTGIVRSFDVSEKGRKGTALVGLQGAVALAQSADGRQALAVMKDGTARLWDTVNQRLLAATDLGEPSPRVLAKSPDGRLVATAGDQGSIRLWSFPKMEPAGRLSGHEGSVRSLSFVGDGSRLASVGEDGWVKLWDCRQQIELAQAGEPVKLTRLAAPPGAAADNVLPAPSEGNRPPEAWDGTKRPFVASFSPDRKRLAVARAMEARLLDVESGRTRGRFSWPAGEITAVAVADDGLLVLGGETGIVAMIDPAGHGQAEWAYWVGESEARVLSLRFSPDGNELALSQANGALRIWNRPKKSFRKALDRVGQGELAAYSFQGRLSALASPGGKIRIDNLAVGSVANVAGNAPANALAWSPSGGTLAIAGSEGGFRTWSRHDFELKTHAAHVPGPTRGLAFLGPGEVVWGIPGGGLASLRLSGREEVVGIGRSLPEILALAASDSGERLCSLHADGSVMLWDTEKQARRVTLNRSPLPVQSLDFLSDRQLLAEGGAGEPVRLWDLSQGMPLGLPQRRHFPRHDSWVAAVGFSPDGKLLASGGFDGTVRVGSVHEDKPALSTTGPGRWASALAWRPDGSLLIAGWSNGMLQWLAPGTLSETRRILGGRGAITGLVFSADGTLLAAGAFNDPKIRIFDTRTGEENLLLEAGAAGTYDLALAPDGRTLNMVALTGDHPAGLRQPSAGVLDVPASTPALPASTASLSGRRLPVQSTMFDCRSSRSCLAAAGGDGTIRLWRLPAGEPIVQLPCGSDPIPSIAFAQEGDLLLAGGEDGSLRGWSTRDWQPWLVMPPTEESRSVVTALAPGRDGSVLWRGLAQGDLVRLDLSTVFTPGRQLAEDWLQASSFRLEGVALLRDHRFLGADLQWARGCEAPVANSP
jgi:WD40 repeat protein/serine/threonine protein kinase